MLSRRNREQRELYGQNMGQSSLRWLLQDGYGGVRPCVLSAELTLRINSDYEC